VREQCLQGVFREIVPFATQLGIKLALENLSYTSTGFGKNVEELEEILGVIDEKGAMGITFDLCHSIETKETQNLLEKYGSRICNVHMANKAHKPFTAATPELSAFLLGLSSFGYGGPITSELSQGTTIEKITQTKAFFDGFLEQFRG
jgi:sugar phosphate isomerase/epimerase